MPVQWCGCGFAALLGNSCCANGARRAECSAFRQSEMHLRADAGLLHESNRQRMRAVAVPRKAKLRAKIMHRVVRPTKAFIPRQRHVAEGGCTTWVHRTAASAKCSLLHQMQAAENAGCSWLSERCCANAARRAECSAFLQSEMRLSANAGLLPDNTTNTRTSDKQRQAPIQPFQT